MRRRVSCELCPGARRASHRRAARGGASGSLSLCVSGFPRAASTPWRREMSDLRRASVASAPSWPGLSRALFWADERHRVTPGLFWGAAHPPCGTAGCAGDDAPGAALGTTGRAGGGAARGWSRACRGASRCQRGLGQVGAARARLACGGTGPGQAAPWPCGPSGVGAPERLPVSAKVSRVPPRISGRPLTRPSRSPQTAGPGDSSARSPITSEAGGPSVPATRRTGPWEQGPGRRRGRAGRGGRAAGPAGRPRPWTGARAPQAPPCPVCWVWLGGDVLRSRPFLRRLLHSVGKRSKHPGNATSAPDEQPQFPGTSDFRDFVLEMQKTITDLRTQVPAPGAPSPPHPPHVVLLTTGSVSMTVRGVFCPVLLPCGPGDVTFPAGLSRAGPCGAPGFPGDRAPLMTEAPSVRGRWVSGLLWGSAGLGT